MKQRTFVDRRGDEYKFIKYSTGEIIIKKQRVGIIQSITISDEAVVQLLNFLGGYLG